MTTEGEQQEAVCGTCGGSGRIEIGDTDFGALYDDCRHCNGTGRITAPVVPSDLIPGVDERCAEHGEYGCEDCHISRLGIPASATMQDVERLIVAPPTPSQDAEGNGLDRAWASYDRAVLRFWRGSTEDIDRGNMSGTVAERITAIRAIGNDPVMKPRNWGEVVAPARVEVESAIREPYEARVKALLTSSIAQSVLANFKSRGVPGVCDVLERDWGEDEAAVAEFCAALTRIEESLGGRKDG